MSTVTWLTGCLALARHRVQTGQMSDDARWAGAMPESYDRLLGPAIFEPYAADLAERARALAPRRVLEVAAGTGIVTRALLAALPDAEVVATDLNPPMVAYAGARAPGATWQVADAQQLSFEAGTFDLVACQFGVMFFPDRVGALAEFARVLRPAGAVLLSSWDTVETSTFPAALVDALVAVLPDDPPTFVARVPHGYADPARIRADLERAGLRDVEIERVELDSVAPSAAAVAEGFCLGSPLRFELEKRGDLGEVTARMATEMTARLGEGPLTGTLAAYVVTAHAPGPPAGRHTVW